MKYSIYCCISKILIFVHRHITRKYHNKKDTWVKRNTPKFASVLVKCIHEQAEQHFYYPDILPMSIIWINVKLWYRQCTVFWHTLINSGMHCVKPGTWTPQCITKLILAILFIIYTYICFCLNRQHSPYGQFPSVKIWSFVLLVVCVCVSLCWACFMRLINRGNRGKQMSKKFASNILI